jgi:hypothetical protein
MFGHPVRCWGGRDLAEECCRLATTTISNHLKNRYLLMANDYILLADIEEQELLGLAHRN